MQKFEKGANIVNNTDVGVMILKITDITGKIENGMWNYEAPFPVFDLKPLPQPEWVDIRVWCEIFDGMHSQTGTYLETPAHFFGPEKSYDLDKVDVASLCDVPVCHLKLDINIDGKERPKITKEMLEEALGERKIQEKSAIIISCGYGKKWFDKDYLDASPFISREAMEWIVEQKPYILGADLPRWENLEKPEGIFPIFYAADILMLAPLCNLEKVGIGKSTLTVLPINVTNTSCAPCRAIIKEDI